MAARDSLEILVIEDDADTRANLRDILELDAYGVEAAGSVAEALARQNWERYFTIILDRRLPDGTAETLLPQLKRLAPHAAVLIVTGYRDLEGALACLREGAADYILKPINPDALRASVGRIAKRRKLELDNARSEAKFRYLVEAADCMIVITQADHTIAYFGPFSEELSGYSAGDMIGKDFFATFARPGESAALAEQLDRALAGELLRGIESAWSMRDGSLRWVLWNARRMENYDQGPTLLIVGLDITARRAANERAMQAERLAAIGQMTAGLAHESRNALQRSKAALEMLALEIEDRPEALDLVQRLNKAQDHLHKLYEEVREYAAPINVRFQQVDVAKVLDEAWDALAIARRGREITMVTEFGAAERAISGDPFALEQVFRNILENAIAACPDPGEIRVVGTEELLERRPAIRLSICDNGPGLNAEQCERIFEPFYTTKTRGTGLGMAISKRIVEAHRGSIEARRQDGGGAEIVIRLPRLQNDAPSRHG